MTDIEEALEALKADGLAVGPAWERSHQLAQDHEGEPAYDQLHAFLHRIEGDEFNAAYWYRRSGEAVFDGNIVQKFDLLIERTRA